MCRDRGVQAMKIYHLKSGSIRILCTTEDEILKGPRYPHTRSQRGEIRVAPIDQEQMIDFLNDCGYELRFVEKPTAEK